MSATETAEVEAEARAARQSGKPVSAQEAPDVTGSAGAIDHKKVGVLFVVVGLLFLIASGVIALFMRAQLATPESDWMWNRSYRQLFTLHGVFGVFLFLAPVWIGLATAVVPLQIGAVRLAFARLQVFALCLLAAGGAMIVASPFASGGAIISGWTLSFPIPEGAAFRGQGPELLVLGLGIVVIALVLAAVNLIVTIVRLRAPGLTMRRAPMFTWSVLVSSSVLLLALPVLVGGLTMLFVDQHYNGRVFSGFTGSNGGNALLWPRLFWFAAYPTLWALLIPALGAVSEIIPVFFRTKLFSRERAMGALAAIGVLAFLGWGSEVTNLRGAKWVFAIGALAVLAPTASIVANWLATAGKGLRGARKAGDAEDADARRTATPVLHSFGLMVVLAIGLGGALVAAIDATGASHRNYWGVATQHSLFFGASLVGFMAAVYYWGPKLWGRHLSEGLGRLQFGTLILGLLLTVVPMYVLGIQEMHVHLSTYDESDGWQAASVLIGVGGAVTVLAVVLFVLNLLISVVAGKGRPADANPWSGGTLEWATSSPPPRTNFVSIPEIRSDTPVFDVPSPVPEPGASSS